MCSATFASVPTCCKAWVQAQAVAIAWCNWDAHGRQKIRRLEQEKNVFGSHGQGQQAFHVTCHCQNCKQERHVLERRSTTVKSRRIKLLLKRELATCNEQLSAWVSPVSHQPIQTHQENIRPRRWRSTAQQQGNRVWIATNISSCKHNGVSPCKFRVLRQAAQSSRSRTQPVPA